jgi:hypothetical protein
MAFYRLEPFGQRTDQEQTALLTAITANANRDRRHKRTPFQTEDFMPGMRPGTRPTETQQAFKTKADSIFAAMARRSRDAERRARRQEREILERKEGDDGR